MSLVSTESVAERLGHADLYVECPDHIDEVQTHISHVFLTNRFAYKLKKPVRYEFLDFSTIEKRRRACEAELRLNRRLAPDVYLAVLPVKLSRRGRLSIDGSGTTVDWIVKMRRLPSHRRLDHMISQQSVTHRDIERLTQMLNSFYAQQPPLMIRPVTYRDQLRRLIRSNWSDLLENLPEDIATINRVHSALMRFLSLRPSSFDQRVCDGRIVDGHGDLRPDHVYFVSPPAIIDCLEFNEDMRRVDIADELSFFAMECDLRGRSDIGNQVLDAYCAAAKDAPEPPLVAFYKAYRACVRAKVCTLRAAQDGADRRQRSHDARRYLKLATRQLSHLGPRWVIAVTGLSGSGKSTLASALADTLGATLLQTDALRKREFGGQRRGAGSAEYDVGRYQSGQRQQIYNELLASTQAQLSEGSTVVLDGTFLRAANRQALDALAKEAGVTSVFVRCTCPVNVAVERIQERHGRDSHESEAFPGLVEKQLGEFEPDDDLEVLHVDTRQPLEDQVGSVLNHLRISLDMQS